MLLLGPIFTEHDVELAKKMAHSEPYVVAVDGGADLALLADIAVDYYIGDGDSATPAGLSYVSSIEGLRLSVKKDDTDFGAACAFVASSGIEKIVCVGFVGGRFDHQLALLGEAMQHGLSAEFLGVEYDIFLLGKDDQVMTKGYKTFSVIALTEDNSVSVEGGEWDLERETLIPLTSRGVSNTGDAHICVHRGYVTVVAYR